MNQKISTDEELVALLASLGDSADEVADALYAAGVRGKPDDATCCPVANWLGQESGLEPYVEREGVCLYLDLDEQEEQPQLRAETPAAVAEFIRRFDHDDYPQLDERLPHRADND
jgi:hypothetical protein